MSLFWFSVRSQSSVCQWTQPPGWAYHTDVIVQGYEEHGDGLARCLGFGIACVISCCNFFISVEDLGISWGGNMCTNHTSAET